MTDNGTVVYNGDDDVSVGVQPLTENFGGEQIDSVRALITIANADAPHEYAFDFILKMEIDWYPQRNVWEQLMIQARSM